MFPVKALSVVFKAKYRDGLKALYDDGKLAFHGELAEASSPEAFRRLLAKAFRTKWVVYAKEPFGGPEQVLAYLSRYTHRVAISSGRLLKLDAEAGTVAFQYKDYARGSQNLTMQLELAEFLRRFCLHILPARFVKIRHFGLLSNRCRRQNVAQARAFLQPEPPGGAEDAAEPEPGQQTGLECEVKQSAEARGGGPFCPFCHSASVVIVRMIRPNRQSRFDESS